MELNQGKTRVWNAAQGLADLQAGERLRRTLPREAQALLVLGTPLGTESCAQRHPRELRAQHDELLDKLPLLPLQGAWLLLMFCAAPWANYLLRVLPLGLTKTFAQAHDAAVLRTLAALLLGGEQLSPQAQRAVQLPLQSGGLGLRPAEATRHAAYWASWIDAFPAIQRRNPRGRGPNCGLPVESCCRGLAGYVQQPSFCATSALGPPLGEAAPPQLPQQVRTSRSGTPSAAGSAGLWPLAMRCAWVHSATFDSASRVLLLSHAGHYPSRALTVLPTSPEVSIPSSQFHVLLLRSCSLCLGYVAAARALMIAATTARPGRARASA